MHSLLNCSSDLPCELVVANAQHPFSWTCFLPDMPLVLLLLPQASVEEHKACAAQAAAQVENLKDEVAAAREVIHDKKNKAKRQKAELRVSTEGVVRDGGLLVYLAVSICEQLEMRGMHP